MIKTYLKRAFQLSDSGVKGLAKSIWSFFLYYVSFVPPMICVFLFADRLLNGNTGKPVVYLLFMLAATLVMYLVINYNYKTTYDETYQESANLRIDLAEQLSKLPLSYFSKHNLSDLAQTIMADVASIEHAFANAVANSIGFAIYFLVISVALLIMNWKLGLCVLLPVLTSASVLFLTKKLQVRDVNKHYDKLRDISESFQNAIELNQEIKSYGLKEKVEAQMDQQLDESENLQWKAQITQTIPVTIGQTLSILPIGITATVGLSMLASGQVSILILLGYIIMAAKLSGAMGGVLLYLTEIFYLDARIARIGEIKNHELQGGEKAVLSDFNVEIKDVCFSYQKDTQVIRHASFTAEQGQVTALVGPSGCGKSTLMKIIAGIETADGGTMTMQKGLKLGYLAQQGQVGEGRTVLEELESVFEPVQRMEQQLRDLEHQMADAHDEASLHRLGSQYDQLTRRFEESNGYGWRSTVQGVLAGLGFRKEQQGQMASLLSGGERTRLCLGRMLLTEPDLLLLDEPTNHLDLKSIAWLEDYLRTYRGAVLLISHDRYFMDHVCDRMCELLLGATECYDGNYSAYMVQRTERFEIRMKAYELQQKEIARQEAIIARYRQFNREKSIRLAESREKRLEKVERLEKPKDESAIHFHFDVRRRTGDDVLMIDDLAKGFSGRTLFEHVKMHLRAGDRVALIGDNGVGKSTLFKCIVGEEKPDCGTIRFGAGVDIGYYDQHQAHLHENKTVLDEVWDDFHRLDQTEVRGALGLFLFTGDDVLMPISTLSGGEKGRVALTKLMLKKDNVLLLDEPTNHLDMDSREVLEDALENFPGTILAISHDRYFINRFATKVCVLEAGGVKEYLGNYDDYFEKINRQQAPDSENAGMTKTAMDKEKRKSREEERDCRGGKGDRDRGGGSRGDGGAAR